jgi:hypothetical protein
VYKLEAPRNQPGRTFTLPGGKTIHVNPGTVKLVENSVADALGSQLAAHAGYKLTHVGPFFELLETVTDVAIEAAEKIVEGIIPGDVDDPLVELAGHALKDAADKGIEQAGAKALAKQDAKKVVTHDDTTIPPEVDDVVADETATTGG